MKKLITVLCIVFLSLNIARAALVEGIVFIDNLNHNTLGDYPDFFSGLVFNSETTDPLSSSSSDFSDTRRIDVTKSGALGSSSVQVVDSELQISTNANTTSVNTLTYANVDGFDLTLGRSYEPKFEGFIFGLKSIDQGGVDIDLIIDGETVTQFVNTVGEVLFSKTEYSTVDFTSVHEIIIRIHNKLEVDATFEFFEYGFIPEPATLALFSAGLFGVGFVRRRRFKL